MIRTIVTGQSETARRHLCRLLDGEALVVVGQASTSEEAAQLANRLLADVIVAAATAGAWRNGARASGPRSARPAGSAAEDPHAAHGGPKAGRAAHAGGPVDNFSQQELKLLMLLARGYSNKHLAAALDRSRHTIKNALTTIYAKLGVASRGAAVARALELGLISRPGLAAGPPAPGHG
jgi:LuxR family maltose regulon positive regulatory protein